MTLASGHNLTGPLTGLNIETETIATRRHGHIAAYTAAEACFKRFGQVELPRLAIVQESEHRRSPHGAGTDT